MKENMVKDVLELVTGMKYCIWVKNVKVIFGF